MRIYITAPYDPAGIEEVDTLEDPTNDSFTCNRGGCFTAYIHWFSEGYTWHRTRDAAVKAARQFRAAWIKKTTEEAARIAALPDIV